MREGRESYCVYVLSCSDGSFYTGMTCNLERRMAEHQAGRGAQWTQRRLPVKSVFSVGDLSYRAALKVERYIKSLTRVGKEALIARDPRMLSLVEKRIVHE